MDATDDKPSQLPQLKDQIGSWRSREFEDKRRLEDEAKA
jgi:hypothetical protein